MTVTPDSWTVLETLRQSHRLLQVDVERLKTQCAATHGPATTASSSETTQQKQRHLVECAPCFSAFLDRLRQRYASSLGSTEWYAHRPSSFRAKLDALLQQQPTQPTNVAPSTASTGSSSSAIAAAAGRAQQLARLEDLLRREKLAWYGDALAGGASGSGNGLSLLSSSALSASGSGSHSPSSTAAVAAGPASAAAPATGPGTTAVRSDDAGLLGTLSGGLVRDVVTALTGEDPTEAHAAADQLLREARRGGNGSNGSGGEAEAAAFDDVVDAVRSGLASAVTVDDVAAAGTQPTVEMDYEALLRAAQADADAEIRRDDVDAKDGEKMDEEAKGGKVRDPRVIEATALLVRLARAGKQEAGSGLTSSPKAADEGNKESGTATHGSAAPQPSDAVEAMDVDEGGRVTEEKASGAADSPLPEGLDRYLRMLSVSAMSPLGTTSSTTTVAQLLDPVIRQMLADHAEQQRLDRRIAEKKAELERQRRALGVYERRQQGRKRGRGGGVGDEDAKMAGDDGGGKRLGAIAGHGHSSAAAGQPGTAADAMSTGKMRCGNCGEAVDESRYWTCALCRVLIDYGFYDETSGVFCSKTCYDEGFVSCP